MDSNPHSAPTDAAQPELAELTRRLAEAQATIEAQAAELARATFRELALEVRAYDDDRALEKRIQLDVAGAKAEAAHARAMADRARVSEEAMRRDRDAAVAELEAMRGTLSWRITRPIRLVRRLLGGRAEA